MKTANAFQQSGSSPPSTARQIPLSHGYVAWVDAEDYERCMEGYKWYAHVKRYKGSIKRVYARRNGRKPDGTWIKQLMHCFIMGTKGVDHEDSNGLHNWRSNLRPATAAQNSQHARLRADSTSGFKGVYWDERRGKWWAEIQTKGKTLYLGSYTEIEDARAASDAARLKHHKEFALTNAMLEERKAA